MEGRKKWAGSPLEVIIKIMVGSSWQQLPGQGQDAAQPSLRLLQTTIKQTGLWLGLSLNRDKMNQIEVRLGRLVIIANRSLL